MLKYRDFMSLSNTEIIYIINDIFKPEKIENINRDFKFKEIYITINWKWDESSVLDMLILKEDCISADFQQSTSDNFKYKQYLLAKGINELLKDNHYLEEE